MPWKAIFQIVNRRIINFLSCNNHENLYNDLQLGELGKNLAESRLCVLTYNLIWIMPT